jgi:quercetin dioxygenase-like cupin family protein
MALEVWDARRDIRNLFISPEIRARIMRFEPHQISSGHTHDLGHEMFLVLDGQAEFTIDGETAVLGPGQACVARAGQWHEVRAVGDGPMTLYLSVTPHIEPTHTQWDHEGGQKLPYRYGVATRAERAASLEPPPPPSTLLERHLAAAQALAREAQENAAAQTNAVLELRTALAGGDAAAAHAAIDAMWSAFSRLYASLQDSERAWNDLAATQADHLNV